MAISTCFLSLLQSFDSFSIPITPLINKQEKFSHISGQIPSLLILLLTGYSFVQLMQDLITYSSPRITQNIVSNPNPQPYYFTPENFFFSFAITNGVGLPIENTPEKVYYIPSVSFCTLSTKNLPNGTLINFQNCSFVKTKKCDYSQFLRWVSDQEAINKFKQFQCIDLDSWKSMLNKTYIAGSPSSKNFSYFAVSVMKCLPFTGLKCASQEEQNEILSSGNFVSTFSDRVLDQSKIGNPYSLTAKQLITPFTINQQAYIRTTFKYTTVTSIENLLYYLPVENQYQEIALSKQVEFLASSSYSIAQILCYLDDRTENYQRSYNTIFDVLGNISGLQSILTMFIGFLISPLVKKNQNIFLIDQIFSIKEKNLQEGSNCNFQSIFQQQSIGFKPTFFDRFCWMDQKKSSILNQGMENIESSLDVANIVKKINSIEQLKRYLFNYQQSQIFRYIEQPVLQLQTLNESKVYPFESDRSLRHLESAEKLKDLSQILSSQKQSDKKLVNMAISRHNQFLGKCIDQGGSASDSGDHEIIDI